MFTGGDFGYLSDYLLWCLLFASLVGHTWCFFRFPSRRRLPKLRLLMGNGLVFLCMLALIALIGESYFRFVCVETDSFGMSLPAQRWFALHVHLNALGCRDKEWTLEPRVEQESRQGGINGTHRIAFVGDSFTYGWGIERVEDRFPDWIQAKFNETPAALRSQDPNRIREESAPSPVEVMNVAKPGWGTGDQLQPITDMIDVYGADEIVLCYVPNDIEKLLPRSTAFDPIRPPELRLINPTTSCLVDNLFYRLVVPRIGTVRHYHDWLAEGFADIEAWRAHQQQLYAIIKKCREHGVVLRAVLLPYLRIGGDKYQPEPLHATLHGFFQAKGVPVVDLLPVISGHDPNELVVNAHDAHPNEKANELFADAIWEAFYADGE